MMILHSQKPGEAVRVWLEEVTREPDAKNVWVLNVQIRDTASDAFHDPLPLLCLTLTDLDNVSIQPPRRTKAVRDTTADRTTARFCLGTTTDSDPVMAWALTGPLAYRVGAPNARVPASEIKVILDECGTPITSNLCGPAMTDNDMIDYLWEQYADLVQFNETGEL